MLSCSVLVVHIRCIFFCPPSAPYLHVRPCREFHLRFLETVSFVVFVVPDTNLGAPDVILDGPDGILDVIFDDLMVFLMFLVVWLTFLMTTLITLLISPLPFLDILASTFSLKPLS